MIKVNKCLRGWLLLAVCVIWTISVCLAFRLSVKVQTFHVSFIHAHTSRCHKACSRAHIRKNYDSSFYRSRLSSGADADALSAGCAAWG
jgi:hypothetical protein